MVKQTLRAVVLAALAGFGCRSPEASRARTEPATDGLVAHWTFDEGGWGLPFPLSGAPMLASHVVNGQFRNVRVTGVRPQTTAFKSEPTPFDSLLRREGGSAGLAPFAFLDSAGISITNTPTRNVQLPGFPSR